MNNNFEKLQLKDDFIFSIIMRDEKFCKPFLELVLGKEISRLEYLNSQEIIDMSAEAKAVRLDVYTEDSDTVYDIEMQNTPSINIPMRIRYYDSIMNINTLKKGNDYTDLKQNCVIFVCTFDFFGMGKHVYKFESRCIDCNELALMDNSLKIILNTKGTADDVTPELKNLLDYIDGCEPRDAYTAELDREIINIRNNKKWRGDYMTLELYCKEKYGDLINEKATELANKMAPEMATEMANKLANKIVTDEKIQSAKRMLESGGFSQDDVAFYTGLSPAQVLEVRENIVSYR